MVSSTWCSKRRALAVIFAAILVVLVAVLVCVLVFSPRDDNSDGSFAKIAISIDVPPCAEFGLEIAKMGGSAMDVSIAALLCAGIASPTSMGLGGGFLMTIWHNNTSYVLDAREVAPGAASENMFEGNSSAATLGPLSVAVPAEIIGYWEAHQKFGKLPWKTIMNRAADLFEAGVVLTPYVAGSLERNRDIIMASPSVKEIFVDPKTKDVLKAGDIMKRTKLAETVRVIAEEGGWALNNGSLTQRFYEDIKNYGGIITKEDLANYRVKWREPVRAPLPGNYTLVSVPPPGSGPLLSLAVQTLVGWIKDLQNAQDVHRLVEAFKFMYARRTELGDTHGGNQTFTDRVHQLIEEMSNGKMAAEVRSNISDTRTSNNTADYGAKWAPSESHGTLHLSVVTPDMAVTVTSTINTLLGSKLVSRSTGILLNNEMDDFSLPGVESYYGVPPSPANFIKPGKRPLSSMIPSIILGPDQKPRLVFGASGGTKITTAGVLLVLNHVYFNMSLRATIDEKRIHHQLLPMYVMVEDGYLEEIKAGLRSRGHAVGNFTFPGSSASGISVLNNRFTPVGDIRRGGVVAGM